MGLKSQLLCRKESAICIQLGPQNIWMFCLDTQKQFEVSFDSTRASPPKNGTNNRNVSMSRRPTPTHILGGGPDSTSWQGAFPREGSHGYLGVTSGKQTRPHSQPPSQLLGKRRAPAAGTPLADLLLCSHHRLQPPLVVQTLMHFLHLYKIYLRQGDLFSTFMLNREDNSS